MISRKKLLIAITAIVSVAAVFTLAAEARKIWNDGTYTGTAKGFKSEITVEVTVEKNAISAVKILKQEEKYKGKEQLLKKAFTEVPEQIVKKQGIENIDAVTGATYTSKGIIKAASEALSKAEKK